MNKLVIAAAATLAFAAPVFAEDAPVAPATAVVAAKGKMLVAADGARIGSVYRASSDGAQVILDGRMVTIPNDTLAMADGKLTTSLTKRQVVALP